MENEGQEATEIKDSAYENGLKIMRPSHEKDKLNPKFYRASKRSVIILDPMYLID